MATCAQTEGLIQASLDGELSAAEQTIFDEHVAACPHCARSLERHRRCAAAIFEAYRDERLDHDLVSGVMAHLPEMDTPRQVQEFNWRVKQARRGPVTAFLRLAPAMAPALLACLAFALYLFWPQDNAIDAEAVGVVTYRLGAVGWSTDARPGPSSVNLRHLVKKGERYETGPDAALMLALAGQSRVKVDAGTRIKVHSDRAMRVERGRAWFNIGRDERLFRVTTPNGDVTVFGTTFEVRVENGRTVVTVRDGRVMAENGTAFIELTGDEQSVLTAGARPLTATQVDAALEMAWADAIMPDADAELYYASVIRSRITAHMRAEQVFAVGTKVDGRERAVSSILLQWNPSEHESGHAGYFVYVKDNRMQPLFKDYIPGEVFSDPGRNSYQVIVPGDSLVTGDVLLVQIVPDHVSGPIETSFADVFALGV